ncbi:phosphate--AMP phosphotransferase [Bengtsoniella intestinalis]|uniref:phosphate--AMP phosphotransferase n=1 Tax=Bengtsoniella intestinalis TaxID=3073143 RepID=UPI00391FBB23
MLTQEFTTNLDQTIDQKGIFKQLQKDLALLQQSAMDAKLPVVVLFEGWSSAGKGQMIEAVISRLEPRGYQVQSYTPPDSGEARHSDLWRFWRDIPKYGNMAVLDRSWHNDLLTGDSVGQKQIDAVNTFERQLRDDGYLVLKFFLHIGQKEQRNRLDTLSDKKLTAWRVNVNDWAQNRNYNQSLSAFNKMLEKTNTPWAPWHVIWNEDKYAGPIQVLQTIKAAMEGALTKGLPHGDWTPQTQFPTLEMPKLASITEFPVLDEATYRAELKKERKKIGELHSKLYRRQIPVIIGFEGWDAAGKGGAIRRLSWALDPRGFRVVPVAAPSKDELAHHYLWRFWLNQPKNGHVTIFDRTWYGRTMVELIEGFTDPVRCHMAYQEMNEFEADMVRWGAVVMKFWIHIDQETQLERFTLRQNTPEKQYKITDEDWRNREKWPQYEAAVDEMIAKTATPHAPWHIIEGNDKNYARLKVLKIVRKTLEDALED